MFSAGHIESAVMAPQSGQAPRRLFGFVVDPHGYGMTDAEVAVRNQGEGMGNPYGIAGQQGPAINIPGAARAIRGREAPVIVSIERRIDPQYRVHGRQEPIPGKQDNTADMTRLNTFSLPGREKVGDPESLTRAGGPSRLAGGQAEGVGMANTLGSDIGPGSLNESPAPTRIPRLWNDGLNAAAGLNQYGFTQQNYRAFLKHPWLGRVPFPTRGIRAVSGVRAQMSTASTVRIPAIFVPSAVG